MARVPARLGWTGPGLTQPRPKPFLSFLTHSGGGPDDVIRFATAIMTSSDLSLVLW
jgi:hypothetical protein